MWTTIRDRGETKAGPRGDTEVLAWIPRKFVVRERRGTTENGFLMSQQTRYSNMDIPFLDFPLLKPQRLLLPPLEKTGSPIHIEQCCIYSKFSHKLQRSRSVRQWQDLAKVHTCRQDSACFARPILLLCLFRLEDRNRPLTTVEHSSPEACGCSSTQHHKMWNTCPNDCDRLNPLPVRSYHNVSNMFLKYIFKFTFFYQNHLLQ